MSRSTVVVLENNAFFFSSYYFCFFLAPHTRLGRTESWRPGWGDLRCHTISYQTCVKLCTEIASRQVQCNQHETITFLFTPTYVLHYTSTRHGIGGLFSVPTSSAVHASRTVCVNPAYFSAKIFMSLCGTIPAIHSTRVDQTRDGSGSPGDVYTAQSANPLKRRVDFGARVQGG